MNRLEIEFSQSLCFVKENAEHMTYDELVKVGGILNTIIDAQDGVKYFERIAKTQIKVEQDISNSVSDMYKRYVEDLKQIFIVAVNNIAMDISEREMKHGRKSK